MADFYYYLNRQGVRGLQGVKGDKGDSPIITVVSETPNEYIIKITNPDGTEYISPNLRGNNITLNEGSYVRYNSETGELYTSEGDNATETSIGMVRLATDEDIADFSETTALTPSGLADALPAYLTSPDGSVTITHNEETSQVELTTKGGTTPDNMVTTDTRQNIDGYKIFNRGLSIAKSEDNPYGITLQDEANIALYTDVNNFTTLYSSEGVLKAHVANVQNNNDLFILAGNNKGSVTISTDGIVLEDSKNAITRNVLTDNDIDGQTIQLVDGKLHANTDELGNEVNDLSGRITANEADITTLQTEMTDVTGNVETLQTEIDKKANSADVTTELDKKANITDVNTELNKKQNKLVAGDNVTLTNNEDGTTTVASTASGGEIPTNMVTTDTQQTITARKDFQGILGLGYANTNKYIDPKPHDYGINLHTYGDAVYWHFDTGYFQLTQDNKTYYSIGAKDVNNTKQFMSITNCNGEAAGEFYINNGANQGMKLILPDYVNNAYTLPRIIGWGGTNVTCEFLRNTDLDGTTIKMVDGKITVVGGGSSSGGVEIDDSSVESTTKTWSCNKSFTEIESLQNQITDLTTTITELQNKVTELQTKIDGGAA